MKINTPHSVIVPVFSLVMVALVLPTCGSGAVFAYSEMGFANNETGVTQEDEKKKIPDPEKIVLITKDRVVLNCVWYAGTNKKKTVPIILLHAWGGSSKDHADFARWLQTENGYAVIVPDLRGHGESLTVEGVDREIDRDRMTKREIASISADVDACRKFLLTKNNEGELNIDYLTVIGTGETAIHAMAWSIVDWSYPDLNGIRQGRDAKAVVLIGPERRFKGLSISDCTKHPLFSGRGPVKPLSALVIYTGDAGQSEAKRDADEIVEDLKKQREEYTLEASEPEAQKKEWLEKESVFSIAGNGTGAALTDNNNNNARLGVAQFIQHRVINANPTALWKDRGSD